MNMMSFPKKTATVQEPSFDLLPPSEFTGLRVLEEEDSGARILIGPDGARYWTKQDRLVRLAA